MRRLLVSRETRQRYERGTLRLGAGLAAAGVNATLLTALSVLFAGLTAWLLSRESFLLAVLAGAISGILDMLDGATARATRSQSGYGTLLDRTADRTVEMFFLLGFLLSGHVPAWLALVTLFALFLPSYVRAVAESAAGMSDCEVGLAGRLEKLLVLTSGTLAEAFLPEHQPLAWSLVLVSVLALATGIQRLVFAGRAARKPPSREVP